MSEQTLEQRVAIMEAKLDTFAAKADVVSVRADLHEAMNAQTWRLITWMTGICTALTAATFLIARGVH